MTVTSVGATVIDLGVAWSTVGAVAGAPPPTSITMGAMPFIWIPPLETCACGWRPTKTGAAPLRAGYPAAWP
eukprot:scaffold16299_cov63-Phaeocystis_antarctica.AAC.9